MKPVLVALAISSFLCSGAFAQVPMQTQTCDAQATAKKLSGAAKTSFLKKCKADACTSKAVSADGKPLSGAAKASFLKKCEQGA